MNLKEQIEILSKKITKSRWEKMLYAVGNRTRKLTIVLEDIFQPHNAAAVLRSCDAFGIQDVHIIENKFPVRISNHVDMGTSKWMSIHNYKSKTCYASFPKRAGEMTDEGRENIKRALEKIKSSGFILAASTLNEKSIPITEIPVDKPLAIMIGTELTGLSDVAHEMSDICFKVDMLGFAQSFNLSVFSALCLEKISSKMRSFDDSWKLSEYEKDELLLMWLKKCISSHDQILSDRG